MEIFSSDLDFSMIQSSPKGETEAIVFQEKEDVQGKDIEYLKESSHLRKQLENTVGCPFLNAYLFIGDDFVFSWI